MNSLKKTPSLFHTPLLRHLFFWFVIYSYFVGTVTIDNYSGFYEVLEHFSIYVCCQIIVAYTCLHLLIPRFLTQKKYAQFVIYLLFLLIGVFIIFVGFHEYYYRPKYLKTNGTAIYNSSKIFWEKLFSLRIFLGKSAIILTPVSLLLIIRFYKERQNYLQLNEQKKSNELSVLKHQLNPHFLFNTLNNLYALSIDKSDEAPEVILKLSEMLDYMLYGCNDQYVALQKEIELLNNYIALEKVRYGKRVNIQFNKNVESNVKIAPLILLTFVENAFKHGVSHELKEAFIHIDITQKEHFIQVHISNSIAKHKVAFNKVSIGISNVKKQLELLYLDTYTLHISEKNNTFHIHLKLPAKE